MYAHMQYLSFQWLAIVNLSSLKNLQVGIFTQIATQ